MKRWFLHPYFFVERGVHDFGGLPCRDLGAETTVTIQARESGDASEHKALTVSMQRDRPMGTLCPCSKPGRISSIKSRYVVFPSIILN